MKTEIKNTILASLIADAYSLGAHWVYDEDTLKNISFDWETLNHPEAMWHKGKQSGDFTHYGDQTLILLEYMSKNRTFDKVEYYNFWKEKMNNYTGYIDGSTKDALQNMGAKSHDLSICGRVAPLLLQELKKNEFLEKVDSFVAITHNSEITKTASKFFAELFYLSLQNHDIQKNIQDIKSKYPLLIKWIDEGVSSKEKETFLAIREFGPACGTDGGFAGVIHLLSLDDDFKSILIKNAKAGGDSSARGMIVAMILATSKDIKLPQKWIDGLNKSKDITRFLQGF